MHMRINVFVILALAAVVLTPHRAMARNRHGCDGGIASKKKRERHGGAVARTIDLVLMSWSAAQLQDQ